MRFLLFSVRQRRRVRGPRVRGPWLGSSSPFRRTGRSRARPFWGLRLLLFLWPSERLGRPRLPALPRFALAHGDSEGLRAVVHAQPPRRARVRRSARRAKRRARPWRAAGERAPVTGSSRDAAGTQHGTV